MVSWRIAIIMPLAACSRPGATARGSIEEAEQYGVDVLGQHQHLLGRIAVDQGAAEQDQDGARDAHHGHDHAQRQRVAGELEHQPGQGDQGELVAEAGNHAAAHQPGEVGIAQQGRTGR
jgi:hypothetical protein